MARQILRIGIISAVVICGITHARTRLVVDGQRVTVETERYRAVLEGLCITEIENKLTAEVYAAPTTNASSPALEQLLADRGVQVESLRPAVPRKRFGLCDRTQVKARTHWGGAATVTYTGLQCGSGEQAELDEDLTITLELRVDRHTGDLLITPNVKGNIEQVIGVRDRGVLRNSLHILHLSDQLKMVIPAADGVAFAAADAPEHWKTSAARFRWPQVWEAALFIAESNRGCLGIWADEPALQYGRHLSLALSPGAWHAGFEFETTALIYQCDDITGAAWRLNVFDGYWIQAARRYQEQIMIGQWGMKPLAESTPAWADKVRVAFRSMVTVAADLLPRDTVIAFTSQGWLKGWNDGQMRKYGGDYFPNWPLENPVRYEAADDWPAQAAAAEQMGIHVFPYSNSAIIDKQHPWIRDKIHDRHHYSWRLWQRFYPEQCLDIVRRYGVSGIYEDCSWVLGRHSGNGPDGENWYQGSVRSREYFRQLMPEVAICGERNNEVTARGQQFALSITQFPEHAHPVGHFLFEPFVRVWNLQPSPAGMDADDIRGYISSWSGYETDQELQDDAMVVQRGQVFAHEQLHSYWPETWDPDVMHYFKGRDGTEYRFVSDRGTRFVKVRSDGGAESIYWRVKGVSEVDAPGGGIEGWLAYDGDRIIGLNPHVPFYVVVNDAVRPPAVISAMPEGCVVHRNVIRDGYWLATLDLAENLLQRPAPQARQEGVEQTTRSIRVRAGGPVRFAGVQSVKEVSPGDYELQVALPGGLVAYWGEPEAVQPGHAFANTVSLVTAHDRHSGVVFRRHTDFKLSWMASCRTPDQEISVTWLLRLPAEPLRFESQYGTNHGYGDGANYMVRVNGRELWKEYRPQQVAPNTNVAPPIASATVDLADYAGQTVVFELADNGNQSGGSETRAWVQPRLAPK